MPDDSLPDSAVVVVAAGGDLAAAVNEAASTERGIRLTAGATYALTTPLVLPDTVPFLDGNGATLEVKIPGATRKAPASAISVATGASDTAITDLTIDLTDSPYTRGVAVVSVSRVTVSGLTITGSTFRAIEVAAATAPVTDILIANNTVSSPAGTADTKGEIVSVMFSTAFAQPDNRFSSSSSPIWDRYTTDGTVSPTKFEHRNISVTGNTIEGGYYGVSLSGVTHSIVRDNTITDNMRNISMQNHTSNNLVEGNDLSQSRSSSVHIAYGSDANTVRDNTITSTQATGQGLLQAYTDSDDNTFSGNNVTVSGTQPCWILYVGTDSDNVIFSGNTVTGNARKALVGVESVWDYNSSRSGLPGANPASYMSSPVNAATDGSPVTYNGGWGDLTGVTITDNTLQPGDANAPVIYIGAEVSSGRDGSQQIVGNVTDVTLRGNTIVGDQYSEGLRVHEGSISGVGSATVSFSDDSVGTYVPADGATP